MDAALPSFFPDVPKDLLPAGPRALPAERSPTRHTLASEDTSNYRPIFETAFRSSERFSAPSASERHNP